MIEGRRTVRRTLPPPALLVLLERLPPRALRVLVAGAGRGGDAVAWAAAGHDVVAADLPNRSLDTCHTTGRRAGVRIPTAALDLHRPSGELEAEFDAVWEEACFLRLVPHHRAAYVRAMAHVLKPGGVLYGLFREYGRSGGPPYDITEACIRANFHACFEILSVERTRDGEAPCVERMVTMRRRCWRPCAWKR